MSDTASEQPAPKPKLIWDQTLDTVTVIVYVGETFKSDLRSKVLPDRIQLQRRDEVIVSGTLFEPIAHDDSFWTYERKGPEGPYVKFALEKVEQAKWPCLFKGEEKHDAEGEYEIASFHESKQQFSSALEAYKHSAEQGSIPAMLKLAEVYEGLWGSFVELDYATSFFWHKKAAELGNHRAAFFVANSYQFGSGTKLSYKQAATWLEKALTDPKQLEPQLRAVALYNLGLIYQLGDIQEGLLPNLEVCVKRWFEADEAGSAQAAYNLGILYRNGHFGEKNMSKAASFFARAHQRNSSLVPPQIAPAQSNKSPSQQSPYSPQSASSKTAPPSLPKRKRPVTKSKSKSKDAKPQDKVVAASPTEELSTWGYVSVVGLAITVVAGAVWVITRARR